MSLSPSETTAPNRDINHIGQPRSITEVLAGPHLRELLTDDPVCAVMVEPLRFIAPARLGDRVVFVDRAA